jgi:glycerophosphoryl diester phosphodiesterase
MISDFLYIGHRGTRIDTDENTLDAFRRAIENGANYIELDVRRTKDNKLIILHDETIDRTTMGSGAVRNYKYIELKKELTRKKKFQIPLLSEVLTGLKGKTNFIIELKGENLKEKVPDLVNAYSLLEEVIFSGRILQDLLYIKTIYPQSLICYNITKGVDFTLQHFLNQSKRLKKNFKPDLISLKSTLITQKFVDLCHKNNIFALAWNFLHKRNPLKCIKSFITAGIDGILFDDHKNIPIIKRWVEDFK